MCDQPYTKKATHNVDTCLADLQRNNQTQTLYLRDYSKSTSIREFFEQAAK